MVALLASPFIALVPAMAKQYVHTVGIGLPLITALLVTAQGVGAVAGALALPGLAVRFGRLTMLRTALFTVPLLLCAYALAPSLPLALVAFVAVGAGYIFVLSGLNTVVQLRAPAAARGTDPQHLHDGARAHLPGRRACVPGPGWPTPTGSGPSRWPARWRCSPCACSPPSLRPSRLHQPGRPGARRAARRRRADGRVAAAGGRPA